MASCLIGLGANLGDRQQTLQQALRRLAEHPSITLQAASGFYRTKPVGGPARQGDFLNAAARLQTQLSPPQLLALLKQVESELGRAGGARWEPRSIDLDLLLYDNLVLHTATLVLPHPRMAFRRFVLAPAVKVAPDMVHAPTGWTIRQLLDHLDTAPNYVAVTGVAGAGAARVASVVAAAPGINLLPDPASHRVFPPDARDRGGQNFATQLEFLRKRAQCLEEAVNQPADPALFQLSDFWLDETAVYARLALEDPERSQLEKAWRQLRSRVPKPKLLVLLDPLTEVPREDQLADVTAQPQQAHAFQRELSEQVRRTAEAPALLLDPADPDWAVTEISTAIQAMGG